MEPRNRTRAGRSGRDGTDRVVTGRIASAIGGLLATLFVLAQFVFWVGSATGVVYEICLDPDRSEPGRVVVEEHWTYVFFPPLILSSIDPPGRCVRNTPLHQGLSALGIWQLPPPERQVEQHIRSQEPALTRSD